MKVLLADHHPIFRLGLKCMVKNEEEFQFVGYVDNGANLEQKIAEYQPDIVILEIDLPRANGVGSLRKIKNNFPELKTLVVSCHPEEIYALSAVKAGAHGYIAKTRSVEDIREALLTVSKGGTFLSSNITGLLDNNEHKSDVLKFKKLSTREIEVLNLLARGKRNKEIAQALSINEKTVSTYKTRLLKKLNVDNIADLIHQSRLMQLSY
ncbi:DNA-binding response regulator [Nonlabens spongiae]|uniref:DNA-binding response regulator n=1 Tax=Nonlabens spongiae TaxID=331648 RepID=A0A1W6MMI7_9FLAO|nr:response regulator transcription factor [Nonlabens spongiae]ARN78736.1 DNA-binding response regulator [Nonlabens spongiae]